MLYITLEQQLFQNTNDQFHVRVAKTTEDIKASARKQFAQVYRAQ
jgi:hypothetical protein